jgi:fumarate hydratase subunit alpha
VEAFQVNNFRHSVVADPINRVNTKTNAPAIIHYEFWERESLEISMMLKGGGSENMSAVKMLTPADGIKGVREFVIETVKKSGGNACPPLVVGVGVGGNFETVAWLAKKSLFRMPGEKNNSWAKEEEYLLQEINKLGIGPMGLGGKTTALRVNIETMPCHIASLPVAVNLECHAHRVGKVVWSVKCEV